MMLLEFILGPLTVKKLCKSPATARNSATASTDALAGLIADDAMMMRSNERGRLGSTGSDGLAMYVGRPREVQQWQFC